jgi:hypothetical protein
MRDPFTVAIVRFAEIGLGGILMLLLTGYLTLGLGVAGAIASGLAWATFALWVLRQGDRDGVIYAEEKGDYRPGEPSDESRYCGKPPNGGSASSDRGWYHG